MVALEGLWGPSHCPCHGSLTICSGCRPRLTLGPFLGSFPRVAVWAVPPAGSTASPCVWNACGTRKAPLVASDSSSSGSSDSDDDDNDDNNKAKASTESTGTATAQEPTKDRAAPTRWEGISTGWAGPWGGPVWFQCPLSCGLRVPWEQGLPLAWHRGAAEGRI